jgi:pyrophosphatase PpaX
MKLLQTLLFDLDGTLLNSIQPILDSFAYIFKKYLPHKIFLPESMVSQLGTPLVQQMNALATGNTTLAQEMVLAYRAHNIELMKGCSLYPEVLETLQQLKARGYTLGVVTSKGRQSATMSLEQHQLLPLLDVFLGFEDTERHKPQPEPILEALRRVNAKAESASYLGDATHDIHCAKAAKVKAFAALWGPYPHQELLALKPDEAFASMTEFLQYLP